MTIRITTHSLCWLLGIAMASGLSCDSNSFKIGVFEKSNHGLIHSARMLYPTTPGSYPVFTWLHGWQLEGSNYDDILCDAAQSNIVICMQMDRNFAGEQLDVDAKLLMPFLHDANKGILPKIGSARLLPGYSSNGQVGVGGHSRGGGVLAYGYSHGIVADGDFSSLVFMDPVTAGVSDVLHVVHLNKTKVRSMYFNDAHSSCVVDGWPKWGNKFECTDINVLDAAQFGCKHMDITSGLATYLPVCHSNSSIQDICKAKARQEIASAGFGPAVGLVTV